MSEALERVSIVNRNEFEIRDRCDGIAWDFPSGVRTVVPAEVARHIFGFPGDEHDMYQHMCRRWGWNRPEHYKLNDKGVPLWLELCRKISIAVEKYEIRRVRDPGAPIPAETADAAPEMMSINDDTPPPRRGVVGRRRTLRGGHAKRQLTPRVPRPAKIDPLGRTPVEPAASLLMNPQGTPEPS